MKKLLRPVLSSLALALAIAGCGQQAPAPQPPTAAGERSASVFAAKADAQGRTVVTVHFRNRAELQDLAQHGVDLFENVDTEHGTVGATLNAKTRAYLERKNVAFDVMMGAQAFTGGIPKGYQTFEVLQADLQKLALAHPSVVHLSTIGTTLSNRPMIAVNLTSHPGANLPAVKITSGQHARELPPVEITSRFIHLLAESYGTDPAITKLVDTHDVWIVPVVNPDGREKVQAGDSMWRKNGRVDKTTSDGVDTNRNCDDHWKQGDTDASADDYHGASPFSEPETQGLRAFCQAHRFAVSLDIHNYAGMLLWPPGYDNSLTKDDAAFSAIGHHLADHIGYKAGTIARTIYNTYGDSATWEYDAVGTLAFACELNDSGFNAPYAEVDRDWSVWKDNLLYLVGAAGAPHAKADAVGLLSRFPGL